MFPTYHHNLLPRSTILGLRVVIAPIGPDCSFKKLDLSQCSHT